MPEVPFKTQHFLVKWRAIFRMHALGKLDYLHTVFIMRARIIKKKCMRYLNISPFPNLD